MKILHVINSLSTGGAEKLVADIAPLQRERGHNVDVLCLRGGKTPFREMLEAAGIRVIDFGAGTVYSPFHIFRLIPFIRKYDVIHVHLFPAQYWVAFAKILSFAGTRLITTEHSTHNRRRESRWWKPFDRLVYRRYDAISCCSELAETSLADYLRERKNILTVANGIDLAPYASAQAFPRKMFGVAPDDFLVMQIAGFREAKDQDTVIRALAHLPKRVVAAFVGDGVRREACARLAESLGVRERVHFLGIRADVPELLKAADAVVMSSHWEGFGLAAVEGMAAGKPVIASDVPGLAGVVRGAGILFPQGDEKALAGAITHLVSDKDFCSQTAAVCFRRACDFDIRRTVEKYEALYEKCAFPAR